MDTKTTEYIDREALKEAFWGACKNCLSEDDIADLIDDMPAADVAPVVRGTPVRKNRESREVIYLQAGEENGEILYKRYVYVDKTDWVEYCSACGKRLCSRFNNYCPNCGAKMDKEEA